MPQSSDGFWGHVHGQERAFKPGMSLPCPGAGDSVSCLAPGASPCPEGPWSPPSAGGEENRAPWDSRGSPRRWPCHSCAAGRDRSPPRDRASRPLEGRRRQEGGEGREDTSLPIPGFGDTSWAARPAGPSAGGDRAGGTDPMSSPASLGTAERGSALPGSCPVLPGVPPSQSWGHQTPWDLQGAPAPASAPSRHTGLGTADPGTDSQGSRHPPGMGRWGTGDIGRGWGTMGTHGPQGRTGMREGSPGPGRGRG